MIGDDDFFMQNADYHYGATDTEKLYGRGVGRYDDDYVPSYRSSGSYGSSGYVPGYGSSSYDSSKSTSNKESVSSVKEESSETDNTGKYCIGVFVIIFAIVIIANVVVPAVNNSLSSSVIVDDLKVTRYIYSTQYDSKISSEKGYEVTYNERSYGDHAVNIILYSKNGEILRNDSQYMGDPLLGDVPYRVILEKKADYAIFEVYKNRFDVGEPIYRERVKVDNVNVIKEFINYDTLYEDDY
ncbi:MAG: hypothetical protein IJP12_01390 [Methanobrevibacter sp.]|nr:hypothetical protein [Methanobrevibacter sp.]